MGYTPIRDGLSYLLGLPRLGLAVRGLGDEYHHSFPLRGWQEWQGNHEEGADEDVIAKVPIDEPDQEKKTMPRQSAVRPAT